MKVIRVSLCEPEPSLATLERFDEVAEEMYGKLLREFKSIAEIPDLDASPTRFHVHVSATRHLGVVTTLLRKMLRRCRIEERVVIERLSNA